MVEKKKCIIRSYTIYTTKQNIQTYVFNFEINSVMFNVVPKFVLFADNQMIGNNLILWNFNLADADYI